MRDLLIYKSPHRDLFHWCGLEPVLIMRDSLVFCVVPHMSCNPPCIANFAQTLGRHGVVPIVFRQRKSFTDCMTTQPSAHRPIVLKTEELDCTVKKKKDQIHLSINYARSEPFDHIQLSTSMPDELDPPHLPIAPSLSRPFSSQVSRLAANSAAAHFEAANFA